MARAVPHVFTIAPGQNFAQRMIEALLAGRLIDLPFAAEPALLADLTIYVPTQRMRRVLELEFAQALAPRPAILPRIRPLAEPGDPLEQLLAEDPGPGVTANPFEPVISPIRRRFLLLPLIETWRAGLRRDIGADMGAGMGAGMRTEDGGGAHLPDAGVSIRESLALAAALGRLIDEMMISGVPLDRLASTAPPGYDPARFDAYWQKSREFLGIAARYWPEVLKAEGARDEMAVRLASIEAEAQRLVADDSKAPILVIGSTGSVNATARLMRAVSRLDHGAVVLPGLDLGLDAQGWSEIGAEDATLATRFAHPQAALKRLVAEIGISREDVALLGEETPPAAARNRAISEALRPAESVDVWRQTSARIDLDAALAGVSFVEAADEREEALAIAVLMRETLEDPEASVAFVTADRALACRVRSEMRRWDVEVEDSAGTSLAERPAGILLRLLLRAGATRDGGSILALLRHPLVRFGFDAARLQNLTDALEILVFRGRHFSPIESLQARVRHALANPPDYPHAALARIDAADHAALSAFAALLEQAFAPFGEDAPVLPFSDHALDLIEALGMLTRDASGAGALEGDADGAALIEMLREIALHGASCPLPGAALAGAVDVFLAERVLPSSREGHPRAAILGLLEARLVAADRVILGALNEGTLPPVAEEDAFLNRAMRLDLGLLPPERRIGQSAHDFSMLAGQVEVILTRAARTGGQPAIPSRFLRRLEAFVGEKRWNGLRQRGEAALRLARALDEPETYAPIEPPAPVPQAPRVPKRLSITEIETLRRDPYAVYARHILGLAPLEPIEPELDGRERGTILHACLDAYARTEPPRDAAEAAIALRDLGAKLFEPIRHERELFHFWWQRFLGIIPAFVAFDRARRDAGYRVLTEVRARAEIPLPGGDRVTISGKADRIEIGPAGEVAIFDYKSGAPPTNRTIERGLAPQLPITAVLVQRQAFDGVAGASDIGTLAHITIGGAEPLEIKSVAIRDLSLADLAERNWRQLEAELLGFARGETAYRARLFPAQRERDGDYDHLARVREWHVTGGVADVADEPGEDAE